MRYIRRTLLVLLTLTAAACSALTEPKSHDTCSGGTSEWTKCSQDSTANPTLR